MRGVCVGRSSGDWGGLAGPGRCCSDHSVLGASERDVILRLGFLHCHFNHLVAFSDYKPCFKIVLTKTLKIGILPIQGYLQQLLPTAPEREVPAILTEVERS